MKLPFLDRQPERARLARALASEEGTFCCLYGRRRLGKSRLVQQSLPAARSVYYVGDERDAAIHRAELSREMARLVPGFAAVSYPSWSALLERWWADAPAGAVLALDEFPWLVSAAPELPTLLQRLLDRAHAPARHLVLLGSSQRMMLGLVLDAAAPLYGRARELLPIGPLGAYWLGQGLKLRRATDVVEHWAAWGGCPRYWELAADYSGCLAAVEKLALDPLGVLHREPERLLLDDWQEPARAASLLALVGQGSHRLSEIAGRLGQPATSLSRPLSRLIELGLLARDVPFGASPRNAKVTSYRVADPFLRFWYRFVDADRTRLQAGQVAAVRSDLERAWPAFLGQAWEQLARQSVARLPVGDRTWLPASRWWSRELELDIVAEASGEPGRVLVGEAKLSCAPADADELRRRLATKAARCPQLRGRRIEVALWVASWRGRKRPPYVITAAEVVDVSR